jgi:hypothetical protein
VQSGKQQNMNIILAMIWLINSSLGIKQQSLNVKQIKEQIFGESNLLKNSGITYF